MYQKFKKQLMTSVSSYGRDDLGNFAVMAALSMTLIFGAVGAGIDVSGAVSERTHLQDITDTAALAAASSGEREEVDLRAIIDESMANYADEARPFTYDMTIVDDIITVSAKADYKTAIMNIFGFSVLPVSAKSGVPLPGSMPVYVSLVVDTTASMEGANLDALQDAAGELIDIIEEGKDVGSKMAVVPFSDYVNVGFGNRNAPWMDVPDDYQEVPACFFHRPVISRTNCRPESFTRYDDGRPFPATRERCDIGRSNERVEVCPTEPITFEWRGCAGSRNAPENIQAAASNSTAIPGVLNETCGSELLPLTDDFGDIEDAIDNLTTRGDTYLTSGLIWGWRSLTQGAPYETDPITNNGSRAIVFMTDGGNTMTQFDKFGTGEEAYHLSLNPDDDRNDDATERMMAVCDGIKADGITIYTVAYNIDPDVRSSVADLRACASNPSFAFTTDDANDLADAFTNIGNSISSVRLTF